MDQRIEAAQMNIFKCYIAQMDSAMKIASIIADHNEDKILPSDGVYAGYAIISDKKFIGMINIGKRPTVEGKERRVEMNIFDYNDMLYGKEMKISFIKRIRDERKFKNLDDLSKQLKKDKLETIKIIENEEI